GANDHNGRRKYLQDFTRAFRSYQSVISRDELIATVAVADVVLIGDYHALPSAQQFAATLLESRALAGDRPVVLGVETIFAGESHLAPGHLPRALDEHMPSERKVTVLQNVDALYWQAAGEKSDHVEAVRVADGVVCAFNSTPLEKYENYRLHLTRWRRGDEGGA